MGLKLSRKIRSFRINFINKVKEKNITLYKVLILIGAFFKFIVKINKLKSYQKFSKNLDKINNFEYKITSQNNEDGIINHIFSKLKVNQINFIEIGFDYFENNSLNLVNKTSKGLFIDGDQDKVFLLKNLLKITYPLRKIEVICELINKDNINSLILKFFKKDDEIDFISIDVDGIDYFLLDAINVKPKLICIEYNFWYGKEKKCSVPYKEDFRWKMGSLYSGTSLQALNSLANSKGYYLVALDSSCVNAFFIREDLKDNFEILDPVISFKEPIRYNSEEIEKARQNLLKEELIYF